MLGVYKEDGAITSWKMENEICGEKGNKRYIIKMVSQKGQNSAFLPFKNKLEIRACDSFKSVLKKKFQL